VNASSFCYFSKDSLVQRLLHELKYKGNKELGIQMGKLSGKYAEIIKIALNDIDCLIPLPLFAAKERIRGYNQAAVLCNGMAGSMNIPVYEKAIVRPVLHQPKHIKTVLNAGKNIEGKFLLSR
jgi:predicted amidophosphoribosyltransferase